MSAQRVSDCAQIVAAAETGQTNAFRFLETFGQVEVVAFDRPDLHGAAARIGQGALGVGKLRVLVPIPVHENAGKRDELPTFDDGQEQGGKAEPLAALIGHCCGVIAANDGMADAAAFEVTLRGSAGEWKGFAPKLASQRRKIASLWRRGVPFGRADIAAVRGQV